MKKIMRVVLLVTVDGADTNTEKDVSEMLEALTDKDTATTVKVDDMETVYQEDVDEIRSDDGD